MADLAFNALVSKLPSGAIIADSGDVLISVRKVMGETGANLTDQKLGEFLSKILEACSKAQDDWNAVNSPKFRSYNAPSAGTPVRNATTGEYSATFTYTISVNIPLNRDTVDAVETTVTGF